MKDRKFYFSVIILLILVNTIVITSLHNKVHDLEAELAKDPYSYFLIGDKHNFSNTYWTETFPDISASKVSVEWIVGNLSDGSEVTITMSISGQNATLSNIRNGTLLQQIDTLASFDVIIKMNINNVNTSDSYYIIKVFVWEVVPPA